MNSSRITKITVARLFNTGNYEHTRYELTVDIPEGQSVCEAITGVEKILSCIGPLKGVASEHEIAHATEEVERMKAMDYQDWDRHYRDYTGTRTEIITRHEEAVKEKREKRNTAMKKSEMARALFDNIGGASRWTEAKLDWENEQD